MGDNVFIHLNVSNANEFKKIIARPGKSESRRKAKVKTKKPSAPLDTEDRCHPPV